MIQVLAYPIHTEFSTVHRRHGMEAGYRIVISLHLLLLIQRTFSYTDTNLIKASVLVVMIIVGQGQSGMSLSPFSNETDEIDIAGIAGRDVAFGFLGAGQTDFLLAEATLGSIAFHLFHAETGGVVVVG